MTEDRIRLEKVRAWAQRKIDAGQEPPWSWYEHMKLSDIQDQALKDDWRAADPYDLAEAAWNEMKVIACEQPGTDNLKLTTNSR